MRNIIKIKTVYERDIDLLIIRNVINNEEFLNAFLSLIDSEHTFIDSVIHSDMNQYGESDITIILRDEKKKFALLQTELSTMDREVMIKFPEKRIQQFHVNYSKNTYEKNF